MMIVTRRTNRRRQQLQKDPRRRTGKICNTTANDEPTQLFVQKCMHARYFFTVDDIFQTVDDIFQTVDDIPIIQKGSLSSSIWCKKLWTTGARNGVVVVVVEVVVVATRTRFASSSRGRRDRSRGGRREGEKSSSFTKRSTRHASSAGGFQCPNNPRRDALLRCRPLPCRSIRGDLSRRRLDDRGERGSRTKRGRWDKDPKTLIGGIFVQR